MVPAVLRFIDTRGGSHNIHYVNLAEYQPQALHVGNQDPLRRRLALFTPHFPRISAPPDPPGAAAGQLVPALPALFSGR